MSDNCAGCCFSTDVTFTAQGEVAGVDDLQCRRFPRVCTVFVKISDWCGEFKSHREYAGGVVQGLKANWKTKARDA